MSSVNKEQLLEDIKVQGEVVRKLKQEKVAKDKVSLESKLTS